MPFNKGRSGNPAGRPVGSEGKTTKKAKELLSDASESIIKKCIELAEEGDQQMIKIAMDRILPIKKSLELSSDEHAPGPSKITFEFLESSSEDTTSK